MGAAGDKRRSKSYLRTKFPEWDFDVPFSEHDQLWSPDFQEGNLQQARRAQQLLNQVGPAREPFSSFNSDTSADDCGNVAFRSLQLTHGLSSH